MGRSVPTKQSQNIHRLSLLMRLFAMSLYSKTVTIFSPRLVVIVKVLVRNTNRFRDLFFKRFSGLHPGHTSFFPATPQNLTCDASLNGPDGYVCTVRSSTVKICALQLPTWSRIYSKFMHVAVGFLLRQEFTAAVNKRKRLYQFWFRSLHHECLR